VETRENTNIQGIQVISRAAKILRLLAKDTSGLSLAQIANEVNLPRSTVQRIVSALSAEGFIGTQNGNGTIRLGPQIQILAKALGGSTKERLLNAMQGLSASTGETVDLAILENDRMRFIDQIEGSQRLRTVSKVGDTFPLTTTANGKAALACLERSDAIALIKSELGNSVGHNKALKRILIELDHIKNGAAAKDENEHSEGICALGFAVQDEQGQVYAVSVPVPSTRYSRDNQKLRKAVEKCMRNLV